MAAAARAARAAGADAVDCGHLLAALRQADDGRADDGRADAADGGEPDPRMPVSPHVSRGLASAARQVASRNHQGMDYSHLLVGAIAAHRPRDGRDGQDARDGPDAGAPCAIEALVQEADGGWQSLLDFAVRRVYARVSAGFPYVGEDFVVPRAERSLAWVQRAVIVAGYAGLGALAYAGTAPGPARAVVAVYLVAALAGLPLLNLWVGSLRVAARVRKPDAVHVPAPGLAQALARTGLRTLDVVLLPPGGPVAGRSLGRAFRFWGRGTVVMRPVTRDINPEPVRFVTAHEAAHLARGDTATLVLAFACLPALAVVVIVGGAGPWLIVPAVGAVIVNRWITELACDRIAARVTGRMPSLAFAGYLDRVQAAKRNRGLVRLRSLLTHPPASLRRAVIKHALGRASGAETGVPVPVETPPAPAGSPR